MYGLKEWTIKGERDFGFELELGLVLALAAISNKVKT